MKQYKKTIAILLFFSFVCVYIILDLLNYAIFQGNSILLSSLDYSEQFKFINIFGVILLVSYILLLFVNRSNDKIN